MSDSDIKKVQPISGAAVCIKENESFNVEGGELYAGDKLHVAGFSSFVQLATNDPEAEGRQLISLLQRGVISFFGAFFTPEKLKRDYTII